MVEFDITISRSDWETFTGPLKPLLHDLARLAGISNSLPYLPIVFMPGNLIGDFANRFTGVEGYPEGQYLGGLALPKNANGGLGCLVLIDEAKLDGLTDHHRPCELILTVLEELIHVVLYTARWGQDGDTFLDKLGSGTWEEIIASRIHDEYAACRIKANISATVPLFDHPTGGRTTMIVQYGDDPQRLAMLAQRDIAMLREAFKDGPCDLGEAMARAQNIAFRGLLEPMARAQGFHDGCPEDMPVEENVYPVNLPDIEFAQFAMADLWPSIRYILQESHDSKYSSINSAVDGIRTHVATVCDRLLDRVVRLDGA